MNIGAYGILGVAGASIYYHSQRITRSINNTPLTDDQEKSARNYVITVLGKPQNTESLGIELYNALLAMKWADVPSEPAVPTEGKVIGFASGYPDIAYITAFNMNGLKIMQLANSARKNAFGSSPSPVIFNLWSKRVQAPIGEELITAVKKELASKF